MSDLGEKIKFVCTKVAISEGHFKKKISESGTKYYIHGSKIDELFRGDKGSRDNQPTIKRVILFFKTKYRLHIPEHYFDWPADKFIKEISKQQAFAEGFLSTYQVLRPFQNDPHSYAAEALEITTDQRGIINFMYSHNFSKAEEVYEGAANIAKRYYHSLLSRPHEDESPSSAFRSILFYVGEELRGYNLDFLSGLMLRGVSGKKAETKDYAVAVPFLAIPVGNDLTLRQIEPTTICELDEDTKLCRLHKDGHIFTGTINKDTNGPMFDYCSAIFQSKSFRESLFKGNDLALHTSVRNRLRTLNINSKTWKCCIEKVIEPE